MPHPATPLSASALALTLGLLWGGAMFVIGLANPIWPPYGGEFLRVTGSVYPGPAEPGASGYV